MVAVTGLVAEFKVSDAVRLRVSPERALLRPGVFRGGGSVQVFYELREMGGQFRGGQRVVGQRDHRLLIQPAAQFEELIDAEFPLRPLRKRPDRILPVEIMHETSAWIAQHAGIQRFGQFERTVGRLLCSRIPEPLTVLDALKRPLGGADRGAEDAAGVRRLQILAENQRIEAAGFTGEIDLQGRRRKPREQQHGSENKTDTHKHKYFPYFEDVATTRPAADLGFIHSVWRRWSGRPVSS